MTETPADPRSDDRALVQAVLANAPGAFARLVREYQGLCWHIIQRMVRNPEDARELCQDTFLKVHQHLHQYRHESALKSWIGRVAYTVALRHLERKRIAIVDNVLGEEDDLSLLDSIGDGRDLEADCADEEMHGHLLAAIDTLPPLPRTVLTLYHLDELSIPEIAQVTGLAAGTIKSHLFRTRLKLRETLETRLGVPS
ncbi:MAG: sigma-70 family RNA polymerase sigma factor [Pseudomonadota bacterium]